MTPATRCETATAEAPCSVGNVATGFDILGHTIAGPVDRVSARRIDEPVVRVRSISGVVLDLPRDPERNTALRALGALRVAARIPFGFEIDLVKGIPLGSGMGGSAASAVAALVAANALLDQPMNQDDLYPFAVEGEAAASGSHHGDNVGPMLAGGLTLATSDRLIRLPVPDGFTCVLVHPHFVLETRLARAALQMPYSISAFVPQSDHLAQLVAGLFLGDLRAIRRGLEDVLVEPRRAHLIPGFGAVKRAALGSNALGASISGGGPSVFAWFENRKAAEGAVASMQTAFRDAGLESDVVISPVDGPKARVIP